MSDCLLFTLGKGFPIPDSKIARYRTAQYEFPDGHLSEPDAFFGFQLLKWLQQTAQQPVDRVLILGTNASMWDALYEIDSITNDDQSLEALSQLSEQVDDGRVERNHLADIQQRLSKQYQVEVECAIIPEGRDDQQQTEILSIISESDSLKSKCGVHMCVTHGLRSLPILQFLSLNYLVPALEIKIRGLYYGAFELRGSGPCPVVRLDGASEFLQWTRAIQIASQTGQLSGLTSIVSLDDEIRRLANQYQFSIATTDIPTAQRIGHQLYKKINRTDLGAAGNLVKNQLLNYLKWAQSSRPAERLWHLASLQLNCKNYRLASLIGQECAIFALAEVSGDRYGYQDTAQGRQRLQELEIDADNDDQPAMQLFSQLRNAMAHGTEPRQKAAASVWQSSDLLAKALYEGLKAYRKFVFD